MAKQYILTLVSEGGDLRERVTVAVETFQSKAGAEIIARELNDELGCIPWTNGPCGREISDETDEGWIEVRDRVALTHPYAIEALGNDDEITLEAFYGQFTVVEKEA